MKTGKIGTMFNNIGFSLKKSSPEILMFLSIAGFVGCTVLACRATWKAKDILDEHKGEVDAIKEDADVIDDVDEALTATYIHTGVELTKAYAPAVIIGTFSIVGIFTSNKVQRKRNANLAAAYALIDQGFKQYRKRVTDQFGEKVDRDLMVGLRKQIDEETGREKIDIGEPVGYGRFFEQYTVDENGNMIPNFNWQNDNALNLTFLRLQERYLNDVLVDRKRLFLNDIYRALGFPETKAGQIIGWVYDPDNPVGDNYISFGLNYDSEQYEALITDPKLSIYLDFNPDGNIWNLM